MVEESCMGTMMSEVYKRAWEARVDLVFFLEKELLGGGYRKATFILNALQGNFSIGVTAFIITLV